MPEGVEGIAEAASNAVESATEAAGQAASNTAEVGASEIAQNLATSIESVDAQQGPQAALENLASEEQVVEAPQSFMENQDTVPVNENTATESVVEPVLQPENEIDNSQVSEGDGQNTEGQEEGDEGNLESDALSLENEKLRTENDALRAELEEKTAQLEAYNDIKKIVESLDLSVFDANSEQTQEQKEKAMGLVIAALKLMLAFFKHISSEKGDVQNSKKASVDRPTNPPNRPPEGRRRALPKNEKPDNVVDFKPRTASAQTAKAA